jgi:hypothetical protein
MSMLLQAALTEARILRYTTKACRQRFTIRYCK